MTPLLAGRRLTKSFGGLAAVREVDFELHSGEIVGLIGPNGAGKTTLFNLISGLLRSDRGSVFLEDRDISGLRPFEIRRSGIARTFQVVRPFPEMSCLENIFIGIIGRGVRDKAAVSTTAEARHFLNLVGLAGREEVMAKHLALIDKKRLELARALAGQPKVLLLDETLCGLNPTEMATALGLIETIRREFKTAIFWIEHVMGAIMKASDRIIVMDQGQVLCQGRPQEIASNPKVIAAYLGNADA